MQVPIIHVAYAGYEHLRRHQPGTSESYSARILHPLIRIYSYTSIIAHGRIIQGDYRSPI